MKNKYSFFLLFWCLLALGAQAQDRLLQSGPMVGYSEMKEVALWVQTSREATVHFTYWDQQAPKNVFSTAKVRTTPDQAFAVTLLADQVEPGKKYGYALYFNNRQVSRPYPLTFQAQELWQWRTDPPAVKFVIGSCAYVNEEQYDRPGKPYGSNHHIFTTIAAQRPDFMLWLGDNTYLREPDWNTRRGILHRYTHSRSLPELQPLLGSVHHYAIWDDHDFGPNDSDRSFWNKELTLEAFKLFWANPNYGLGGGGITGTFTWADAQFFLLDNRYFRSPNGGIGERTMLGQEQLQWLIDALTFSRAPFKFVAIGGQVLNPAQVYENYSNYGRERAQLLQLIADANIPGVIFLDGDRHHTELSRLDRPGAYPLYDLTVSPLTAGTAPDRVREEPNTLRVPDTFVNEHNFAVLEITGPRTDRLLQISLLNHQGQPLWQKQIKASEIR
jgi:alkaline phosphatase D